VIAVIFEWIVVGAANRLVAISPELVDQGGVTADEAFKLLATEWGRHVRYSAQAIVRAWNRLASPIGAIGATGPTGRTGNAHSPIRTSPTGPIGATGPTGRRT